MEPHQEERQAARSAEQQGPEKKRRFGIMKLEERIAPGNGHGKGSNNTCHKIATCDGCSSISGTSVSGSFY